MSSMIPKHQNGSASILDNRQQYADAKSTIYSTSHY